MKKSHLTFQFLSIVALIVTIATITPTIDPMLNLESAQHNSSDSTTLKHQ